MGMCYSCPHEETVGIIEVRTSQHCAASCVCCQLHIRVACMTEQLPMPVMSSAQQHEFALIM